LALGLEVYVEGEALVFGVVLMGVFEAEETGGCGDFGGFGAAGAEELEDGVGLNGFVLVAVGVETKWGFVAGVDMGLLLGGSGLRDRCGLLGFEAGGCEEGE
jgi:hypothetical protein